MSVSFGILTTTRGDVAELIDANVVAFAYMTHDAYGNPGGVATTGTATIPVAVAAAIANANPLRYAGYCYDGFSGLYYLSQRYYDPATAQFITKDPAKADGEESAYQYCGGDPVGNVDPSGLMAYMSQGSPRHFKYGGLVKFSFTIVNGVSSTSGSTSPVVTGSGQELVGSKTYGVVAPKGGTYLGYVLWQYSGSWMRVEVSWTYPKGSAPSATVSYRCSKSGKWRTLPWSSSAGFTARDRLSVSAAGAFHNNWVRDVKVKLYGVTVVWSGPRGRVFRNPRWGSRPSLGSHVGTSPHAAVRRGYYGGRVLM